MSEKKTCYRCGGVGSTPRTVVIGTIVTIVRDMCITCRGSGKVDK